ncbi:hypothetical protein L218DRAFT_1007278 [Marasmius fiardii PR-910]|nr:hypothetical protein L218DRAFT_1007278 [Marasmius fiardii PR-910]
MANSTQGHMPGNKTPTGGQSKNTARSIDSNGTPSRRTLMQALRESPSKLKNKADSILIKRKRSREQSDTGGRQKPLSIANEMHSLNSRVDAPTPANNTYPLAGDDDIYIDDDDEGSLLNKD